jgi:enolase-phosphatase E1
VSVRPAGIEAILLDIEGTTTPLAFVTEVLFPYVRTRLHSHLEQHAGDDDYKPLLTRLQDEHQLCRRRGETPPEWTDRPNDLRIASAIAFVEWLMDRDRKCTPLKELQGRIWKDGYERGALVGQVFPDVLPALRRWHDENLSVCIYSSGSVLAQRLLFRYSSSGDLTGLLHAFFDTNVGGKTDAESYRHIVHALGLSADAIMFLSDMPGELEAAGKAGLRVRLVIRPGNLPLSEDDAGAVRSFDEI